jgi:hypothetical protein
MLVDVAPDSGFYHVQTEDDQVGWIVSKYITVSESSPMPPPALTVIEVIGQAHSLIKT